MVALINFNNTIVPPGTTTKDTPMKHTHRKHLGLIVLLLGSTSLFLGCNQEASEASGLHAEQPKTQVEVPNTKVEDPNTKVEDPNTEVENPIIGEPCQVYYGFVTGNKVSVGCPEDLFCDVGEVKSCADIKIHQGTCQPHPFEEGTTFDIVIEGKDGCSCDDGKTYDLGVMTASAYTAGECPDPTVKPPGHSCEGEWADVGTKSDCIDGFWCDPGDAINSCSETWSGKCRQIPLGSICSTLGQSEVCGCDGTSYKAACVARGKAIPYVAGACE